MSDTSPQSSWLGGMPPKATFILGIVGGVMALCTIGFFILLTLVLKGSISFESGANAKTVVQAPTPSPSPSPSAPAAGEDIKVKPVSKDDHVKGNSKAPITLIEFSDLECPFCKRFHPTAQQLIDKNPDTVKWVYRHFPLRSLHSKAAKEAEASECAAELGGNEKFWAFIDKIYAITPSNDGLDLAQLPQIAEEIGLNRKKFEECLSSGKMASKVQEDEADASAAGAQGTPYSILVGKKGELIPISGAQPYEQLQAAVDSLK